MSSSGIIDKFYATPAPAAASPEPQEAPPAAEAPTTPEASGVIDQFYPKQATPPVEDTPAAPKTGGTGIIDQIYGSNENKVVDKSESEAQTDEHEPWWEKAWDWTGKDTLKLTNYNLSKPSNVITGTGLASQIGRGVLGAGEDVIDDMSSPRMLALTIGTLGAG